MKKVKVAVIGCGGISREHVAAHIKCPGSEIVYCVDIKQDAAKEKAEIAKCQWHTDYLAVLDEVDAVDICTAPHAHAKIAVEAVRRGKHVLTEKVMARTLPEARWMIAEAEKADIVFMVAFVLRYWPEFEVMHDVCTSGRIGEPLQAYIQTQMNIVKSWLKSPRGIQEWRQNPYEFPMGAFLSHGCHYVDLLQWCVGPVVETANLSHAKILGEVIPGGDDTNCAIFRHENGAVSTYCESWAIPYQTGGMRFEVYGTEGSVQLSHPGGGSRVVNLLNAEGKTEVYHFNPAKKDQANVLSGSITGHLMQREIDHFISAIQNREQPRTHGREGIKSMQVVLAAEAAEREGHIINVKEFINRPDNTKPWNEADFRALVDKKYNWRPENAKSWDEFRIEAKKKYNWARTNK